MIDLRPLRRVSALLQPVVLFALLLLSACSEDNRDDTVELTSGPTSTIGETAKEQAPSRYIELGDLPAIEEHGALRILIHQAKDSYLPRAGGSEAYHREMLQHFAESQGLKAELIAVAEFDQLIPALLRGEGDVIEANLTVTENRQQQVDFSRPLNRITEHIVSAQNSPLTEMKQLASRQLAVQSGTTFWQSAEALTAQYQGPAVIPLTGELQDSEIFDRVAAGDYLTIADSNVLAVTLKYRQDLHISGPISSERPSAWALRPDSPGLKAALDRFIVHEKLTQPRSEVRRQDWQGIVAHGRLRVVLPNNSASYFLWRGQLLGFDYELMKDFCKKHNLQLEVVVAHDHRQLLALLRDGHADVAAGFLSPNSQREQGGIKFAEPYHWASELIVSPRDVDIEDLSALTGHTVHARRSSSYWHSLSKLRESGIDVALVASPEEEETETAIGRVAAGDYPLTAADNHILDIELTWRDDIKGALSLGEPVGQSWAVRDANPLLLSKLNDYIEREYRGLFYNITYRKYFQAPKGVAKLKRGHRAINEQGELTPYDELLKKHAALYDFDWRLLAAQMYQESNFDPRAKSWAGAQGLFQVMPRTARELGIRDLKTPENGIRAGVEYMNWTRDRFPKTLLPSDRLWFTLAAYNAGAGHVRDAITLARQQGLNPNRWFDNVERAMLLLSQRKYAAKARHGYVRGQEPVNYVRQIRDRFQAYVQITQPQASDQQSASTEPAS